MTMASLRLGASALTRLSSPGISGSPCELSSRVRLVGKSHAHCALGFSGGMRRGQQQGRIGRVKAQQAEEENGGAAYEDDDDFDARLAKLQKKATSGSGKKAEARKARKEGGDSVPSSSGGPKESLFIAAVPLSEPFSDGVPVQLGINSYTERLHGRLAALGLSAVLLVELATGDSFIKFHDTGTLTLQVYTSFALAAVFVKFEKERSSVWPKS